MNMLSLQSNTLLLPDETLQEIEAALGSFDVRRAASYGDTWGDEGLRGDVRRLTPNWAGETLITGSATQALILSLQQVGRGKTLAVQVPCYFGVLRQARELELVVRPWTTVDELETLGAFDAVLLTSSLTPPAGISMPEEDKRRVAAQAQRHGAWVIEDNAYDPLWFVKPPAPVLADPARSLRIGSLSKIVSPDFRTGFIRAEKAVLEGLRACKITAELSTPRLVQHVARAGVTDKAVLRWRTVLQARAAALQKILTASFSVKIEMPQGGPYLALPLPENADVAAYVEKCRAGGLLIDDNRHQYPDRKSRPYVRLHYGALREGDIPQVVEILCSALQRL